MAKYNFDVSGSQLIISLVPVLDDVQPTSMSYLAPSFKIGVGKINAYEYGQPKQSFLFTEIGEIDGVAPTDLQDAFDKLTTATANFNGGGAAPYIPLAGTEVDNPVTGDIEITPYMGIGKIIAKNGTIESYLKVDYDLDGGGGALVYIRDGYESFLMYGQDRIRVQSDFPNFLGLSGSEDQTQKISDLDYVQKKYVDERGSVFNATTSVLSASDLNTAYPNAKDGFSVIAPNVVSGGKLYIKAGAGWVYQQILAVV